MSNNHPHRYAIKLHPLPTAHGSGYVAVAPELPGCMSDGETPHEALTNAYDAIACWIEAAQDLGRTVPQPRRAAA